MPKDRRFKRLSSDQSRSSPYPCSSNNTEQCKPHCSLGSDENVQKWKNVRCPISLDHPHDKAEDPRSSLRSTEDAKEWEEIRCPICMEYPHNAVLLRCSSFGKGCRHVQYQLSPLKLPRPLPQVFSVISIHRNVARNSFCFQ